MLEEHHTPTQANLNRHAEQAWSPAQRRHSAQPSAELTWRPLQDLYRGAGPGSASGATSPGPGSHRLAMLALPAPRAQSSAPEVESAARPSEQITALPHNDPARPDQYPDDLHGKKMAEFSASIAHEICQPLLGIAANAAASLRWLQRDTPNLDEAIAGLKDIRAGCERAANIVKALGALARQSPLQPQILTIDDVIHDAVRITGPALRAQRVQLQTGLCAQRSILADPVQLQQLLVNLITNALEAMAGHRNDGATLRISSFTLGNGVEVCVEDNGPGIAVERREQIFSAFYTTKSAGLGVGLALCRSIVDAHKGRIWAQAAACGGARIRFQLPACCYAR